MDQSFSAAGNDLMTELHVEWLQNQAKKFGVDDISTIYGVELIEFAHKIYGKNLVVLTSFGTKSAVLLSMVAEVDPNIRVEFLDTQKLFPETLEYRDDLIKHIGLTNVRTKLPNPLQVAAKDPIGDFWQRDRQACCKLRKDEPLDAVLNQIAQGSHGTVAVVNGLMPDPKRGRKIIPNITAKGNRVDFSPLATFSKADIVAAFKKKELPRHPLEKKFLDIGCTTCTSEKERFPGEAAEHSVCGINLADRRSLSEMIKSGHSLDSAEL